MSIKDRLAEYAHEAWSGWMQYLFGKSTKNPDGSVTIPAELVSRWIRQSQTEYTDLPDMEKISDLDEADKILIILNGEKIDG